MNVLYIFRDPGVPSACKLGLNGDASAAFAWPFRYRQALAHSPRAIEVAAAWGIESKARLQDLERQAHELLSASRRKVSHGREWFDLSADEVIARIQGVLRLGAPFLREQNLDVGLYQGLPYDDWRERKDTYRGQVWKRLLWVFGEGSPERRIKVISSPCFDTAYSYAFTYNPWPVFLIGAYEHPLTTSGPGEALSPGNRIAEAAWNALIEHPRFSGRPMSYQVGWLNEGVAFAEVDAFLTKFGLQRYRLDQPKPECVRPRDSQVSPIEQGAIPRLRRVRDSSEW